MTLQFEVLVQNKSGEIARVAEALSRNSVNIRGISTDMNSARPIIKVVTDDEASARGALKAEKLEFTEREITIVTLADRPGELTKMAKALSKGGINILSMYILASRGPLAEEVALSVDEMARAKEILSKYRADNSLQF